jgi:cytochrome c oxidase assembly protein subunit 15
MRAGVLPFFDMNAKAQNYNQRLHRFILVTAVATFLLLGLGGLVTSHEAGMSVPDWPTSYGYNMFALPIKFWKGGAFFEHTHRLLASAVGLLTTMLAVWLWLKDSRKWMRWLGVLAFVLVALQGVLGGLRVTLHMDGLGIVHGALAQLFFVLICALALFTSRRWVNLSPVAAVYDRRRNSEMDATAADRRYKNLRWLVLFTTLLIFVQLILGATMRHQHAGLAIPDFPAAYGKIWPDTSAAAVARYNADRIEVISENLITGFQIVLQMAHRIVALAIFIGVAVCAQQAWRRLGKKDPLTRLALFWLALIVAQISLGAWTIWSNKAADVATAHVLVGALSLVTGALWCALAFRRFGLLSRIEPAGTISNGFGVQPVLAGNK